MTVTQDVKILSDRTLLEKVDKLRDLNIGHQLPLPQLVVVGDQSSGKSSLLESTTGIPFPNSQTLCTRHPTQITLRRASSEHVDVTIIPGPDASDEHRKYVEGFKETIPSISDFQKQFANILKKANERMGLRTDILTGDGAVFSEDVLKIEIYGPDSDYLTIIDVPGIFRTTTQGTTKEDMVMVKNLVTRYIENERTIILAVLPSNADVATQEILELAQDYDKNGVRTLGILTKPDLVNEPSAQDAVCDLVLGQKRPLRLGYFLVRNRGPNSVFEDQSELDMIFRKQPWNGLPRDRLGISALQERLKVLIFELTEREYPKLIHEASNSIRDTRNKLDNLGPPRQGEREQRSFLSGIAGVFQDQTRAALAADYNVGSTFDQVELRLITHVVNITDVFGVEFRQTAHSRHFQDVAQPSAVEEYDECGENIPKVSSVEMTMDNMQELLQKANVGTVTEKELAELDGVIDLSYETKMPHDNVITWIKETYLQARGLDLGTFNPNLVAIAFAEQSRKWGNMTKTYMSRIILAIHRFIATALRSVCPDNHTYCCLWTAILESLVERYKKAMDQANLLIEVERHKKPYTLNRQFSDALSRARGDRITELLRPRARRDIKQYGEVQYLINIDDIAKAAEGKSNTEQLQEEIHDILRAYYGLALERFIDNVFQLAVDYSLLHGPNSPLKVFTQEWVINLDAEQLERIVGETNAAKKRRQNLLRKIGNLSNALKILKI